jgi:hypothetical protein
MSAFVKQFLVFVGVLTGIFSATLGYETLTVNLTGWVLLVIGILGAAAGSVYLGVSMVRKSIRLDQRDKALWLLLSGVILVGLGSPLEFQYLPALLPRTHYLQSIGLAVCILGFLIAFAAGDVPSRLRRSFSAPEFVKTGHELTNLGTTLLNSGLSVTALGIGLGFSSWIGLAASILLIIPGTILRYRLARDLAPNPQG